MGNSRRGIAKGVDQSIAVEPTPWVNLYDGASPRSTHTEQYDAAIVAKALMDELSAPGTCSARLLIDDTVVEQIDYLKVAQCGALHLMGDRTLNPSPERVRYRLQARVIGGAVRFRNVRLDIHLGPSNL